MKNPPLVSINLVVRNGAAYAKACAEHIRQQTHPHIEVNIFDNDSSDTTLRIIEQELPAARIIRNSKNYGFGGGQNRCLEYSKGEFAVFHCIDVLLDENFVEEGVRIMESDSRIGALQAKILGYNRRDFKKNDIIDTTGFEIFRSRRVVNRGHGEKDQGQYEKEEEIFSYEGACGFFRRKALEDSKINGELLDEDFFWYGDDIDLGWRMRLLGWKSVYAPTMLAWHDRQTTKRLKKTIFDFIRLRREIPAYKRALDYRNLHLTLIKNELPENILRDLVPFFRRECALFLYTLIFEPKTVFSWISFFGILPKIFKKRMDIVKRRKVNAKEMRKWYK